MAKQPITWKTNDKYPIKNVKPTPNNYKLKTEEGEGMLGTSMKDYGLAGSIVINLDGTLINGNSRWKKELDRGAKYISASYPSRMLSPKEFKEFAAIFDHAVAGTVDTKRMVDEMGSHKDFLKKFGIEVTKTALNKLAELEKVDTVKNPTQNRKIDPKLQQLETRQLTLVYSNEEAEDVIELAEGLYDKLKVDNLSDLVYKLLKEYKKYVRK